MSRKTFDRSDHKIWVVSEFERWTPIPHCKSKLEKRSGVYLFSNKADHVKYVGMAGAYRIPKRVQESIRDGNAEGATRVKALYTNGTRRAKKLERQLISKYEPINNCTRC